MDQFLDNVNALGLKISSAKEEEQQRKVYDELVKDRRKFLREKFFTAYPEEFYEFWEFCKATAPKGVRPEEIFMPFNLKLVGPFDVLAGLFDKAPIFGDDFYHLHYRFYYDVPEFHTVMVEDRTNIHFGYWFDIPLEESQLCFIVRNNPDDEQGYRMTIFATNMFDAVIDYMNYAHMYLPLEIGEAWLEMVQKLQEWAHLKNIDLISPCKDELIKKRFENYVKYDWKLKSTFNGIGLIDTNKASPPVTTSLLQRIIDSLETEETNDLGWKQLRLFRFDAQDPENGRAIYLGIALFCCSKSNSFRLHRACLQYIVAGYRNLNRKEYALIAATHVSVRNTQKTIADIDMLHNLREKLKDENYQMELVRHF